MSPEEKVINIMAVQTQQTPAKPAPTITTNEPPAHAVEAQKILKEVSATLPMSVTGLERQMMIGDTLTRMDESQKTKLLALMNHFLIRMFTTGASDIDMGGYGAQGSVWYRVFGSKKPDATLGKYTPDEMNFLIQSVIGERKRAFLYEN
ncbi:MAG: hypothetical protein AAB330_04380, partial [Bacteroidota bacterium]